MNPKRTSSPHNRSVGPFFAAATQGPRRPARSVVACQAWDRHSCATNVAIGPLVVAKGAFHLGNPSRTLGAPHIRRSYAVPREGDATMRSRRSLLRNSACLIVATSVAGCDATRPTEGPGESRGNAVVKRPTVAQSIDDEFAELAKEVPGFGGLYFDASEEVVVYLTDLRERTSAAARLQAYVSRKRAGRPSPRIRYVHGDYSFPALKTWQERAAPLLSDPDLVFTDVDETRNRVRIGVKTLQKAATVRAALANIGIPGRAVEIVIAEAAQFAYTLNDPVRPTLGGLRILAGHTEKVCTLGFNARTASGVPSFVLNSHCTDTQGGTEDTRLWQPVKTKFPFIHQIGREAADPVYTTGGSCPSGRRCRRSDAALATIINQESWAFEVARTTVEGTTSAGSTVVGQRLPVVAEQGAPLAGALVRKTGRTSGSTRGTVVTTCTTYNVGGTNVTLFCQYAANGFADFGDSGSPVYTWSGVSGTGATLVGLLWGIGSASHFFFSSLSNVEAELGPLTTH